MADQKLKVTLLVDKSEYDRALKDAGNQAQTFGNKLKNASSLLKAGLYSAAAITALKTLKATFTSTEGGADKFAAAVSGGKEALGQLMRSVSQADFSNLIGQMSEAYKKGRDLAEVFDQLEEATAFANIQMAKLQEQSNKAWERALTSKGEDRHSGMRDFIAVERQMNEQAKKLAKATYEINKQKWEAVNKTDADYAASVYTLYQDMFLNQSSLLSKYQRFIETNIKKGLRPVDIGTAAGEALVGKEYSMQIAEALYDYFVTFNSFADGGPMDLAKIISTLANSINRADQELNSALRKTRDLLNEEPTGHGIESLITGDFTPAAAPRLGGADSTRLAVSTIKSELIDLTDIAGNLQSVFYSLFSSVGDGWKKTADAVISSIKRIAAEILAKAAVWAIMAILFPESVVAKQGLGAFLGFTGGGGKLMGGLASGVSSIGTAMPGTLRTEISGSNLAIVLGRGNTSIYGNT